MRPPRASISVLVARQKPVEKPKPIEEVKLPPAEEEPIVIVYDEREDTKESDKK